MQIAIYLRKSRKDVEAEREAAKRGEVYDTLAKHRAELFAYAGREGCEVLDVYEEVVSGEFIQERPAMQALLQRVRALAYDAVLVADLDRLGRGDKRDQGWIEKIFKDSDTLILTPFETHDLNQELGEFTVEVKSFLARMEYKQIKKRLQAGRRRSVLEGRELSQKPPYGYVKDAALLLQVAAEEAAVVKRIYDWYLTGMGQSRIAEALTQAGIPSPSGKSVWSRVTVGKILANPKYKGDQVFGRIRWIKQEDGSYRTRKARANEEVYRKVSAHEAIIDAEKWEIVQRVLSERRPSAPGQRKSMLNPFAGVLVCQICGKSLQAHFPKDRPGPYLSCPTADCPQRMIPLARVENAVYASLRPLLERLVLRALKTGAQGGRTQSPFVVTGGAAFTAKTAWDVYALATVEQKNRIIKATLKQITYLRKKEWRTAQHFSLHITLQPGL